MMERLTKIILKTTVIFGKCQMFGAFVLIPIGLIGGTHMIWLFIIKDQHPLWLFLAFIAYAGVYMTKDFIPKWFTEIYTVEIEEDQFTGYNLFNKLIWKGSIQDIVTLKRDPKWFNKGIEIFALYDHKGTRITTSTALDFSGFFYDYILLHAENLKNIDMDIVMKYRNRPKEWIYTRIKPFNTKYEPDYFKSLLQKVEEQKKDLMQKGILDKEAFYGKEGDKKAEKILSEINVI